ncbi:hypothetical protein DW779_11260 [Clostridium sp. AM30-24]|nr:hypothetical protein DW779_11260 [Clostridium sp. AM30-24]
MFVSQRHLFSIYISTPLPAPSSLSFFSRFPHFPLDFFQSGLFPVFLLLSQNFLNCFPVFFL